MIQEPTAASPPRQNRSLVVALWANAALLGLILLVLLSRSGGPSLLPAAFAQNQAPIAGGGGVFVMPAQLSPQTWGCYLLDIDAQTLSCYQYWPGEKKLRLHAARTYKYDRRLENFNTDNPTPKEVQALINKANVGPAVGPAGQGQGGQGGANDNNPTPQPPGANDDK